LDLTTPALLFPAISLLLLAYTNRFLVLAQLIRQLKQMDTEEDHALIARQISMLRKRIVLTKRMQAFGVLSFLMCTVSMFLLFLGSELPGAVAFGISLVLLSLSLLYSFYEIQLSTNAINVELANFEARKEASAQTERQ
jgi:small neutral amino acid transporter SnatA (MarC family)